MLFPATWNPYLIHFKMKRFPKYAATLGFHLVSAITASPLCSVKGQSIQTAPRTFQKFTLWRHTVSHCVTLSPASTAAERKSFCSSAGIICTATQRQLLHQDHQSHTKWRYCFSTLRWQLFWGGEDIMKWIPLLKGTNKTWRTQGRKRVQ